MVRPRTQRAAPYLGRIVTPPLGTICCHANPFVQSTAVPKQNVNDHTSFRGCIALFDMPPKQYMRKSSVSAPAPLTA